MSYSIFTEFGIFIVNQLLLLFSARGYITSKSTISTIIIRCSDEISAEIIYVTLLVHQIFLLFAFNLNPLESFGRQILWVINIYDIFILLLGNYSDTAPIEYFFDGVRLLHFLLRLSL